MPKQIKQLSVRLWGREVGILKQLPSGGINFQYSEKAFSPLSLSLPLRLESYKQKYCLAYFGGLLPENPITRRQLARKYQISENSDFALLVKIGGECAGAVSFYPVGEPEYPEIKEVQADWLTEKELAEEIENLPKRPMSLRRLSLAGAQEKTAVCVENGKIGLPKDKSPSTHILKPCPKSFSGLTENEYICMKAAKSLGISVPNVSYGSAMGVEYFLIERYDRLFDEEHNKLYRLHQEDFTQAAGVWGKQNDKYEFTVKDCAKILEKTTSPILEKENFIRRFVFNFLIGNCDAHGKNYSVLHFPTGEITLTPAYDVVCTRIYEHLEDTMAMAIGGEKIAESVTVRDWQKFAKILDVAPALVFEELQTQAETLPEIINALAKEVDKEVGFKIYDFASKNCENIIKKYNF